MVYVAMTMGNPLFKKSQNILTNHVAAPTVTHVCNHKTHGLRLCFVPEQNTNQKVYFFVLSVNYRSDWCAVNIYYHENILPA